MKLKSASFIAFNYLNITKYAKILNKLPFSKTNTRRICFHKSVKSNFQYMMVELKKNSVFEFHKHIDSDELIFMIKGKMKIRYLQNNKVKHKILSCKNPFFSCLQNTFHSSEALTNRCIYVECKAGQFIKKKTIFYKN